MKKNKLKIGLALGGGGALGMAHIGVLEVLEEHGIHIDYIAGTSMGAIVGSAYASGITPKEMRDIASKVRTINLLDLNLKRGSFLSGASAEKWIKNIIKVDTFDKLKIPFSCTACDLLNGELVVLNSGDLIKSVRASMSVPAVFRPVEMDGRYLVDGGVVCNVPADIVKQMGADIVIAVNVLGDYKLNKKPTSMIGTLLNTIYLQQSVLTKSLVNNVDVYIDLNLGIKNQQTFSKNNFSRCINVGKQQAEKVIPQILSLLNK